MDNSIIDSLMSNIDALKMGITKFEEHFRSNEIYSGIICSNCKSEDDSRVVNCRNKEGFKIRTMECSQCGRRWNTVEVICRGKNELRGYHRKGSEG